MECDRCGELASVHLTEVRAGTMTERHLCQTCYDEVIAVQESAPVSAALTNFVLEHLQIRKTPEDAGGGK